MSRLFLVPRCRWLSRCTVSTWSPLATIFNTRPASDVQFASQRPNIGLFKLPELSSPDGFHDLKEQALRKTNNLIGEAIVPVRDRKLVEVFDEISDTLCKVADLAEFVRIAHPDPAAQAAAEDSCISISGMVERLNTHRELYQTLRTAVQFGDSFETDAVDEHVAKLFLFDFEQCGIHLEEHLRRQVVALNNTILQTGQRFMMGAVQPQAVRKSVFPERIHQFFPSDGDNIMVTGLYADSADPLAREAAYRLFLYPLDEQERLLHELITKRHELAVICGFETYAQRALKASTMETPENVQEFLNVLSERLRPRADKDFKVMQIMKETDLGSGVKLAAWDVPYFTAKLKRHHLQVPASEYTPYFSLGGCMEGLNILMNALFGIRLENVDIEPGETWCSDVYKLAVRHESEGLLGYIYCDLFERSGKPNQDCHFTIQGGKQLADGSYQLPIVVVMLNLNQPRWSSPSLLTPGMVDNLFHEMGHAMHSMLARTRYQHVTGTRCTTDFAEVPSVLMEYFASDPRVLGTFARHFQTHEPMPPDMLRRLCDSKSLFSASEMQSQVFYSALDQRYHGAPLHPDHSTTDVLREVQARFYGLPYVENTAWQLRFSHLVGYGAKYYSYLISRAIASWIWSTYFAADPFSRSQGERYRRECLAFGGEVPSRQVVANFLARDVSPQNLTANLIDEIDANNERIKLGSF